MNKSVWLNGHQLTNADLDRGLQFGDGHFTTLRLNSGRPCWWDYHWQRLQTANQRLLLPPLTDGQQQSLLAAMETVAEEPRAVAKVIVTRGSGGRGYSLPEAPTLNLYLVTSPAPTVTPSLGSVATAELQLARQPRLAGLKSLNRLEQVLLAAERQQRELDDLLVLDNQANIIEACQGNLFWRIDQQWYTPDLHSAGVDGVARQVILEKGWLGEVKQGDFNINDIALADTVMVTNSVRGALPIERLNGKVLATKLPAVLQQLTP